MNRDRNIVIVSVVMGFLMGRLLLLVKAQEVHVIAAPVPVAICSDGLSLEDSVEARRATRMAADRFFKVLATEGPNGINCYFMDGRARCWALVSGSVVEATCNESGCLPVAAPAP